MLLPRITPCLLIHQSGLVKTVGFQSHKYIGDPINAVRIFNDKMADELIVLDIDASVSAREPDYETIAKIAAECRMPLCYGGGITSAKQARRIIGLGVEKVAISSAAVQRPTLIAELANELGRQSVVVAYDVKENPSKQQHEVWIHNGKINTKHNVLDLVRQATSLGAGELLINSIDRDGSMLGYDLSLAQQVRSVTHTPLTILGGAGSLEDIAALVRDCGVVGAAAGSLFVFKGAYRAVLINYPSMIKREELLQSVSLAQGKSC